MTVTEVRYLVDAEGNRLGVLLDLETYERLMDAAEELEDIRDGMAVLEALKSGQDQAIPLEQAIEEFEVRQAGVMEPTR
jgi:PHD/YefM family antitoxin component YafN of YafNO toxin-antitoxin module